LRTAAEAYGRAQERVATEIPQANAAAIDSLLSSAEPWIPIAAIRAAGNLKITQAREPLLRKLGESPQYVQEEIVKALAAIEGNDRTIREDMLPSETTAVIQWWLRH
jgi:hypothetical protein